MHFLPNQDVYLLPCSGNNLKMLQGLEVQRCDSVASILAGAHFWIIYHIILLGITSRAQILIQRRTYMSHPIWRGMLLLRRSFTIQACLLSNLAYMEAASNEELFDRHQSWLCISHLKRRGRVWSVRCWRLIIVSYPSLHWIYGIIPPWMAPSPRHLSL